MSQLHMTELVTWRAEGEKMELLRSAEIDTIAIRSPKVSFAIFNSAYATRIPIIVSSDVTLAVLGHDFSKKALKTRPVSGLISNLLDVLSSRKEHVISLRSPPLVPLKGVSEASGEIMLVFEYSPFRTNIKRVQNQLDVHAQDVQYLFHERKWGELVLSVARIVSRF